MIVSSAIRDLSLSWRSLAITDIGCKVIAFALLTPGVTGLLYWLRSDTSFRVMADADILRFFVTTPLGVMTLVVGTSVVVAITALEMACLMAIGLAAMDGRALSARSTLAFAAARAPKVLHLTATMVLRLLAGCLPFALAGGLVYGALLREHDINYYLAQRPPAFWLAGALVALLALTLGALLVRTVARWALALPLLLFERVTPRRALAESARRSLGERRLVVLVLAAWAVAALALMTAATSVSEILGRGLAPHVAGSLPLLLLFIAALALLWATLVLAAGIVNISLFSLLIARLYLHVGKSQTPHPPTPAVAELQPGGPPHLSGRVAAALAAGAVVAALGFALLVFFVTRSTRPVLVIAHRGASAAAPENTLAAFRLAVEQGADFVELDVQESADGEVLVVHDSDLMKAGGASMKIWETDAARLRTVDIGSRAGPQFAAERVPTLAEVLAVCKGRSRVLVELKSYGHDQRLEERVASVIEAAGMEKDCQFMSLDHAMVQKLKRLRPAWRAGLLVARARGDLTSLGADFLAVEARMAIPRFVRQAHRAQQDVYVWTVNDPAAMLAALGRGVNGLVTDKPDLALQVVARRAEMSDAQRVLVALLIRMGARTKSLEAEEALRP